MLALQRLSGKRRGSFFNKEIERYLLKLFHKSDDEFPQCMLTM
jgi:hypothetical protein